MFCYICFFLTCFTERVKDGETRTLYGWMMMGLVGIILVFNGWFICVNFVKRIRMMFIMTKSVILVKLAKYEKTKEINEEIEVTKEPIQTEDPKIKRPKPPKKLL